MLIEEEHHLALLRGINVGGNNIIKMTALKECFESMGFENVKTYIQRRTDSRRLSRPRRRDVAAWQERELDSSKSCDKISILLGYKHFWDFPTAPSAMAGKILCIKIFKTQKNCSSFGLTKT